MNLEIITVIFLVLVFGAAEIYRMFRGQRGVILSVGDSSFAAAILPVVRARVRLRGGEEVQADLNCCTACLGRVRPGDEVRVVLLKEGYVVDLPWTLKSACGREEEKRGPAECFRT